MSNKRKQEERHLQTLKKIQQIDCNKKCFECDQRGPTYVDVTIGSFVCTSCGGILRGLNPPHRVKSVSMATFTTTEIAFIETRGNEYCKNIYLGKYDERSKAKPESRSDHSKLKYFMEQKYEQKKWYIPPEEAQKPLSSFTDEMKKANEIKPLSSLLGQNHTKVQVDKKSPPQQSKPKAQVDNILGDLNSSNAFGSTSSQNSSSGFADFGNAFSNTTAKSSSNVDTFGDFTSGQQANTAQAQPPAAFGNFMTVLSTTGTTQAQQTKPADKYADLADLFNMDNAPAASTSDFGWSSSTYGAQNTSNANQASQLGSVFGMSPQSTTSYSNTPQQPAMSMFSNVQQPQQQQGSVFGNAQPQSAFGGMQTNQASFGGMQQHAGGFGGTGMQQGGFAQPVSSYGGMQQPTGVFASTQQNNQMFGASNFATAGVAQQSQPGFPAQQTMPAYAGNAQNVAPSPSNPFMQTAGQAPQAPIANVGNPFMAQAQQQPQQQSWGGQAQKPFQAQSSATNPFMAAQPQAPQSTNPFF